MIAAARPFLPSRGQIFAALLALAMVNWFWGRAAASLYQHGLSGGLGLSWGVWVALPLALRLALRPPEQSPDRFDLAVTAACLALIALPIPQLSAIAATGLSVWFIWRAERGGALRAAAIVTLTVTCGLLWSHVLLLVLARPIEAIDAFLVGQLAGVPVRHNIVAFASGGDGYLLTTGCTSMQNASLALMLWIAIARTFRPRTRPRDLAVAVGVFATVVAINLVRLSLMAQDRATFDLLHGETGAAATNALITLSALAWAAFDVRDELFR